MTKVKLGKELFDKIMLCVVFVSIGISPLVFSGIVFSENVYIVVSVVLGAIYLKWVHSPVKRWFQS